VLALAAGLLLEPPARSFLGVGRAEPGAPAVAGRSWSFRPRWPGAFADLLTLGGPCHSRLASSAAAVPQHGRTTQQLCPSPQQLNRSAPGFGAGSARESCARAQEEPEVAKPKDWEYGWVPWSLRRMNQDASLCGNPGQRGEVDSEFVP